MKQRFSDDSGSTTSTATSRRGRRATSRGVVVQESVASFDGMVKRNSAALTFLGLTLGVFISRKFMILPVAVIASMAQEGIRGVLSTSGRRRR